MPLRLPYRSGIESDHITHCDVCQSRVKLGTMWHCPIEGRPSVRLLCHTCKVREYDMPPEPVAEPTAASMPYTTHLGGLVCAIAACCISYCAAGKNDFWDLITTALMLGMMVLTYTCAGRF